MLEGVGSSRKLPDAAQADGADRRPSETGRAVARLAAGPPSGSCSTASSSSPQALSTGN